VRQKDFDVEAVGEIVLEDKTLVIRRITVIYRLRGVPDDRREEVERVHDFHPRFCPVARSLDGGIDVRTQLEFV
jgi:uncharacterized OsmC-like protein